MRPVNLKKASFALLSIMLLLSGGMMLYRDLIPDQTLHYQSRALPPLSPDQYHSGFTVEKIDDYAVSRGNAAPFHLNVARYQDDTGTFRQAIVFPPASENAGTLLNIDTLRSQVWNQAARSIREHVGQNAVFLSWWDNSQRLHFMAGRNVWVDAPIAAAYKKNDEKKLWREIGGGFAPDTNRLTRLAKWLMTDAGKGLEQIRKTLPPEKTAYFLTSMDDLARIQELSLLADRPLQLQSRVFRSTDNFHTLITAVKSWAKEGGTGSYLVQPFPGVGVRAWRIMEKKDEDLLFIRLLPFTHSLENPLDGVTMVFRSDWSGYISIFQLER